MKILAKMSNALIGRPPEPATKNAGKSRSLNANEICCKSASEEEGLFEGRRAARPHHQFPFPVAGRTIKRGGSSGHFADALHLANKQALPTR